MGLMITLQSDRLRLEIAEPGERPNNGSRFDRAGYISEVVLDGAVYFAASEPKNLAHPPTGGRGLCCEYLADYSSEAKKGERYPKFGVGLIEKGEEDSYLFYKHYQNVQMFPVVTAHTTTTATFTTEPIACLGYAMRTCKTVSVAANTLTVEVVAENTGEHSIDMTEYCHNFLSVDGMANGPGYRLELPGLPDFGGDPLPDIDGQICNLRGNGRGITFCKSATGVAHIRVAPDAVGEEIPFRWRLVNEDAKAFVEVEEFFRPHGLEVWTADHIVSPEVFHRFTVEPGASHAWKRRWTFAEL